LDPIGDGQTPGSWFHGASNGAFRVHRRRFGKANGAPYEPLDPGPQIAGFALDFLRVLLAHMMLLWVDVPLVRALPIGVKAGKTKRFHQGLELQKDGILAPPQDIRQYGPTVMINGMPEPPRRFLLLHKRPHFIHLRFSGTTDEHVHIVRGQRIEQGFVHRGE